MKLFYISALLTLLLGMVGTTATAHDISVANNNGKIIYYVWTNNQTELAVSYRGETFDNYSNEYTGNVVIPASVYYNGTTYPVTSIGYQAFCECSGLTSVTIPSSVTSISNSAFSECTGLSSVDIPSSVTRIDSDSFYGCSGLCSITVNGGNTKYNSRNNCNAIIETASNTLIIGCKNTIIPNTVKSIGDVAFGGCTGLTSVTIPSSVTSIGNYAFYECTGLSSVNIPSSMKNIGDYAFFDCIGLSSVTIPSSVTSIGANPFSCCSGLTSITVNGGNIKYNSRNNCNAIIETASNTLIIGCKNTIIPNTVTSIGTYAFYGCTGLNSVTIPSSVTSIGLSAFENCTGLSSVTIPSSVKNIGDYAFFGCTGLSSVTIPSSVTSIGANPFSCCSGLTSITVNGGNIKYNSRNNCNAIIENSNNKLITGCKNTIIPNTVTSIGTNAFYGCTGLTSVTIPSSVTSVGYAAFRQCQSLTSITIPNSVKSIGVFAFENCTGLTSVTIPSSVTSIGDAAFQRCQRLTSITIPNSVTSISDFAFSNCFGLTSVTIPNNLTSIGGWAFADCTGLTSVTIPSSVTSIGFLAFVGCDNLTSVIAMMEAPVSIDSRTFSNRANATLYVPSGCKGAYQAADYWKNFKTIKEYLRGDVNLDGVTDVVDVVDIARFVVATPRKAFHVLLADLNSDQAVNVADAVVLVNMIAGDQDFSRAATPSSADSEEMLALGQQDTNTFSLSLDNWRDYTAFQFDLYLQEGAEMEQVLLNAQRKQHHQLLYNKIGEGHYRVAALSASNQLFKGNSGELLSFRLNGMTDDIFVSDILFFTPDGSSYAFDSILSSTVTNAIADVHQQRNAPHPVYDLQGRRISSQPARQGLYIVNGKKVLK